MKLDILGLGYTSWTLHLRDRNVATLVHRKADGNARGAILYVHGFVDYFFQTHVAEFFTARGWDFYALDLRRYGRSLRKGDAPWFTTDLAEYHEELDKAAAHIRSDGHDRIVAMGHSTGGLILPLWLSDGRHDVVDGLLLNSPWLDLQYNWFNRTIATKAVDLLGRVLPRAPMPKSLSNVYPKSIHKDRHGEWDFNTDWKPVASVPVRMGWFRTVRRGHARLHRGLDLQLPILMLHSDKSLVDPESWSPEAMKADVVLDVAQMDQWAPMLGPNVTTAVVADGLHDLFLSVQPVRDHAFAEIETWLDTTFG